MHGHVRRSQRGAAAVEFALVFPLLVMLLLGITTGGLSFSKALGSTDAVREGSRFGATTLHSPAPSGFASWSAAVQSKVVQLSYGTVPANSNVCVKLQMGTSTVVEQSSCSFSSAEPPNPAGLLATDCVVKVWAKIPVTIDIGIARWDVFVIRGAVARYERTC
jgi:hypothetical protein